MPVKIKIQFSSFCFSVTVQNTNHDFIPERCSIDIPQRSICVLRNAFLDSNKFTLHFSEESDFISLLFPGWRAFEAVVALLLDSGQ